MFGIQSLVFSHRTMKRTFDLKVIRRPKVHLYRFLRKKTLVLSVSAWSVYTYVANRYLVFQWCALFINYCRCYRYLLPNVSFSAEKNGLRLILWAMKFKLQSRMVTYAALHSIICSSFSSLCIPYTLESRLDVNLRISVPSKGRLISNCLFGVIVSTKIATKIL